jgi:DNA-binding transcriptional LysR family regulator
VFHLVTDYVETLQRELIQRNVDFLISPRFASLIDEGLSWEFLFDDAYVVVAGKQSQWVRRRKIELADLANELWVLPPPESAFGSVTDEAWRASGLDGPRARVFAVSYEMRLSLLLTGRFLTIFPASASRFPTWRPDFKVLPVELPVTRPPNGIVSLKNRTLNPVAQMFIKHAREVAKQVTKRKT